MSHENEENMTTLDKNMTDLSIKEENKEIEPLTTEQTKSGDEDYRDASPQTNATVTTPEQETQVTNAPTESNTTDGNDDIHSNFANTAATALNVLKGAFNEAKLFTRQWTGQIVESSDDASVLDAFQKLDAYKEQVSNLLQSANTFTECLEKALESQNLFIQQLDESHTTICTLSDPNKKKGRNRTDGFERQSQDAKVHIGFVPSIHTMHHNKRTDDDLH
ncbi:hypothetical protein RFI_26500, partial [Reticulomyxa filosa]